MPTATKPIPAQPSNGMLVMLSNHAALQRILTNCRTVITRLATRAPYVAITWNRIRRPAVAVALSKKMCSWRVGEDKASLIDEMELEDGLMNSKPAAMIEEKRLTQILWEG
jgi:hypothetical protein